MYIDVEIKSHDTGFVFSFEYHYILQDISVYWGAICLVLEGKTQG